jgi:hypothetical protein
MSFEEMIDLISVLNYSVKVGAISPIVAGQYIDVIVKRILDIPTK